MVDPIDGTRAFAERLPEFSISVARMTLFPVASGSYAPVRVVPVPPNPLVTRLSESITFALVMSWPPPHRR